MCSSAGSSTPALGEQRRVVGVEEPAHGEERPGAAAGEDVRGLGALEPGVHRHEHAARRRDAERGDDPLERVRRPHRDPVAALDARGERAPGRRRRPWRRASAKSTRRSPSTTASASPNRRAASRTMAGIVGQVTSLRTVRPPVAVVENETSRIGKASLQRTDMGLSSREAATRDRDVLPRPRVPPARPWSTSSTRPPTRGRSSSRSRPRSRRRSPTPPGSSARSGRRSTASRSSAATRCRARPTPATPSPRR